MRGAATAMAERLQALWRIDPTAVELMVLLRVPVTGDGLVRHPEVIVGCPGDDLGYVLSVVGLLNGLHGDPEQDVAVVRDATTKELRGFCAVPRSKPAFVGREAM